MVLSSLLPLLLLVAAFSTGEGFGLSVLTQRRSSHLHQLPDAWLFEEEDEDPSSSDSPKIIGPVHYDLPRPSSWIEGHSLKTWVFDPRITERVQVSLSSPNSRPIEASVELWQSPTYTPTRFTVECEDGGESVVRSVLELPTAASGAVTIAVYNTMGEEFPIEASVADTTGLGSAVEWFKGHPPHYVEGGGAVVSYTLGERVESVEVLLRTNHRNLKGFIEILQGPDDDDEVIEVEADNAYHHPFYTVIQTPGAANTLRIVNQGGIEFPFEAYVRPCEEVDKGDRGECNNMSTGGPYF